MVFRRGLLLFALLSIVILSACGGSSNNGPGGGGGGLSVRVSAEWTPNASAPSPQTSAASAVIRRAQIRPREVRGRVSAPAGSAMSGSS